MPDDLTQVRVFANYPAQAMSARQGQDAKQLGATPASAVGAADLGVIKALPVLAYGE